MENKKNYCVLIDSENIGRYYEEIFKELIKYGDTPIRVIFGDFNDSKEKWENLIENFALTPIKKYTFVKGKNSLDVLMIAEGMELLYTKPYLDGIVIVATDSDYTPLARKWRNYGKEVIGIGRTETNVSLKNSCSTFVAIENLIKLEDVQIEVDNFENNNKINDVQNENDDRKEKDENIVNAVSCCKAIDQELIDNIIEIINNHNGEIYLAQMINELRLSKPDFDTRTYGYKKAPDFIKDGALDFLNVDNFAKGAYRLTIKENFVDAEKFKDKVFEIMNKQKNKLINAGELNKQLLNEGFNYEDLGFSRFRKFLETIDEICVENLIVKFKTKSNTKKKK